MCVYLFTFIDDQVGVLLLFGLKIPYKDNSKECSWYLHYIHIHNI